MNKTRELPIAALMIALGIVLPMGFHMFNMGGPAFLPMHIPVLIGGFILSPMYALAVGVLTPVLSSILTSMPAIMPMLPIMAFELGAYGLVISILRKKTKLPDLVVLLIAMILGRIVAGAVVFVMTSLFTVKLPPAHVFVQGAIITGLPGIIIQLILVPAALYLLRKSKNI